MKFYLFIFTIFLNTGLIGQNFWQEIEESSILIKSGRQIVPQQYRTMSLNLTALKASLAFVPNEQNNLTPAQANSFILNFPMPDGTNQDFYVIESPIMEEELAEKFPEIKTYLARGIDDPGATMRFDVTQKGFHGMIQSAMGTIFIDPYSVNTVQEYIIYNKKDFVTNKQFTCEMEEEMDKTFTNESTVLLNTFSNGTDLRTYRFACAATGEYTTFHGGTVADGLAAIVTTTNRVNQVYENDLAIRLVLVANNDQIIYTNGATDPFDNNSAGTLINQSQTEIDNTIGNANYDIGHTVSTGGGGLAGLGVPCISGQKAKGITGSPNPVGDPYDIDYVAHEIGHQFGGSHTFNGSAGSCSSNIGSKAYEPGSGSTIQAYAGICSPQNLQANSDPYFHVASLDQMITYSTAGSGNSCPSTTATGNTPPVASVPMSTGLTIPISTPFELTGAGTDANGDALTYCWEQYDLGPQGAPQSPSGNAPIFRSWIPTTDPVRTLPRLSDLLNNTTAYGEILPTYTRSLEFRLTVRDNRSGGGGVHCATYTMDVDASSGPFLVTSPNTSGIIWSAGASETITWDVANTTAAPVSCANVDILLSTDGGNTYPITLASGVPNDGSQTITVPNNPSTTVRVKVICSDNIFFDISNQNLEIQFTGSTFTVSATPTSATACTPNDAVYTINIAEIGGYTDDVALTATGLPTNATASFSPATVTGGSGSSTLTLTTSGVAPGNYTITVQGAGPLETKTTDISLNVLSGVPGTTSLSSPTDGATDQSTTPTLSWNAATGAETYTVQIATDIGFTNIVENATGLTSTAHVSSTTLAENTVHFWRVRAVNFCGDGSWSSVYSFQTSVAPPCSDEISEGGFENGSGSAWMESSSNGFQIVDNSAGNKIYSGSWSAWLGGADNETSNVWQSVAISPTAVSATLTYYYRLLSNETSGNCIYDYGYLLINGVNQTTYPLCSDNNMTDFAQATFDLSAHIGTTVEIRFRVMTDGSATSSMHVDEVVLEVCEPAVAACSPPLTIPTAVGTYTADMECTDDMGWTHYWKEAATSPATANDVLLLSIEKDATVDISPNQVSVGVTGVGGAVDMSGAGYVTDPNGWFVMNRYWNVSPTTQPGAGGVNVRFYYTTDDYNGVNTAVTNAGGVMTNHSDLYFYKFQTGSGINPDPTSGHVGANSSNYLEFQGTYATYNTSHQTEFSVAGFSGGGGGAGASGMGALPIELTLFKVQKEGETALLTWETAGEINNQGFHIEYSANGKDFERIGWVGGAGSVATKQTYRYIHEDPVVGVNYYRLVQMDFDGTLYPSEIQSILIDAKIAFQVFPNPGKSGQITTLQIMADHAQVVQLEIYDATGKRIMDSDIAIEKGLNTMSLAPQNLGTGIYFISIIHDAGKENRKFTLTN